MKSHRAWNWLIVIATLLTVSMPVLGNQYRVEISRWYLAAAANALQQEGIDETQYVEKASKWVDDITALRDYWLVKVEQALIRSPSDVSQLVEQAIQRDKSNYTIGLYIAEQLSKQRQFAEAIEVLEISSSESLRKTRYMLNQLAYFRSLAVIELDQALEDINLALEKDPNNEMMRDTRAWVLFQMGKPLQALEDANFAIEAINREPASDLYSVTTRWLEDVVLAAPKPRSSDKTLTQREAGPVLWGKGALYYHRARILEALQRTEQAEADYQWLRDHNLPTDDRLY